ncbi:32 kDa beta-galactoside-binding lectin lec-3-like [Anopheles aquasalis]|uniref:32 kDa beta-galactoside-binding lectin lec-3-like n=1 Tax=Anopheles aquasalis TaxID=42839 RepID=UPI00215B3EC8|nr:32 kDa beta-galactoside-binding lectin lec-3-like [Anopheles aquasalis]
MALMLPLFNPDLPCLGALLGGMQIGKRIIIQGTVTEPRFNINLQLGPEVSPRDDTALHLSIRPSEQTIVRNSFVSQTWQEEERFGDCPISVGQPFTLEIRVEEFNFVIFINDEWYCTFQHRQPVEMVNFIHLGTGATIDSVMETF